jgi:hypothetical protein
MGKLSRREFMGVSAKVGGLVLAGSVAPGLLRFARAEKKNEAYLKAKINWRQVEGEQIKVLVTPPTISTNFGLSHLSLLN